jgi:hypothetical protein
MVEFLVKAVDATHEDPDKDRHSWKKGMIVQIYENGALKEIQNPVFVGIKVPSVTQQNTRQYARVWNEETNEEYRRRYYLDPDLVDQAAAEPGRVLTINRGTFRGAIIDRDNS